MTYDEKMTPEERAREVATALSGITRYEGKGDEQDIAIIAHAIRKAVEEENMVCERLSRDHAEFCWDEARRGGHPSLYERSKGADYIARKIAARRKS